MSAQHSSTFNPGKGEGAAVGVAILGYGTVGSQVLRLLHENADAFTHRSGGPLIIRGVAVSNVEKHSGTLADELGVLTNDARALIRREDVDIVVEVIGGIDYPRELVLESLRAGKSVVTANKALVAAHSAELAAAADQAEVDLYFEAAVAAAIPVLGPLRRSLAGDQIESVAGIVNGTTNFILDAMDTTGASYDEMLAEATRLGYAEADPTADVEGYDAASKAAILASLAFHTRVTADDVYREGISKITSADIEAAKEAGYTIKLLAVCERLTDKNGNHSVSARVHPTLIPRSHPLATVSKSFNAIFVEAEAAGQLMFYGNGAGGNPTASAVLGDIVGAARNKIFGGRAPGESTYANLAIADFSEVLTRYHIDLEVEDRVGVLAELTQIFAEHGISMSTVRQQEKDQHARLIIVTHTAKEADLANTVKRIATMEPVKKISSVIRVQGE
ncbi:Homoserine dehydrogenase [Corynebacterium kutscheri]|uniref:Homoserine dehydrogenase n=1 Tax=Corynebacterium kutscheri TaxID=35755 RepID=A0A0F6R2H1_9CORY|nr:homoserine dehydrogenase [Corynebacterium kutscheri]AKE41653.1 homoserine dehydrogenase [Corynebacterium kutscheri]VEH08929.1 Homoserine dehydrogenase [Corynebacterium kutscheri]VEH09980.1 Homoserine dehydrogenase [Corynebacterium kutscheri]VEH80059.1 Homoserine dehydrogenase [Corynebacterium kutscheri]